MAEMVAEPVRARVVEIALYDKGSREEEAELSLKRTDISRPMAWVLCIGFLMTILSESVIQHAVAARRSASTHAGASHESRLPHIYKVGSLMPSLEEIRNADGFAGLWNLQPPVKKIVAFEKQLEEDSEIVRFFLPRSQDLLIRAGAGNEKAYCGRDGWMYFRPEIDYVTAEGFLRPQVLKQRERSGDPVQPDPRKAILQFNEQLAKRGIKLIVMPMPSKAVVHPEKFSARYGQYRQPLQNSSFEQFKSDLSKDGVMVFDAGPLLVERKLQSGEAQFLETDTHWRPEAMEFVAEQLSTFIEKHAALPSAPPAGYTRDTAKVVNLGDIAAMLRLPEGQNVFAKQAVPLHPVRTAQNEPWRTSEKADVLLLGDSYTNIFSLEAMGWGQGAGFAETLSFHLQRPLDRIARNDAGSYATRQMLAAEIAKGNDRLAGKKLVIWEFAIRELAAGDWKLLNMDTVSANEHREPDSVEKFFVAKGGTATRVSATIHAVTPVPTPGTVPYKDHIFALHLKNLNAVDSGAPLSGSEAVVYMWSMRDNKQTTAATWRPGDKINLRLKAWSDVSAKLEAINRSELDDDALQFEEPSWGELE